MLVFLSFSKCQTRRRLDDHTHRSCSPLHLLDDIQRAVHDKLVHVSLLFTEAGDAIAASFGSAELEFKERIVLCSYYREVEGHCEGMREKKGVVLGAGHLHLHYLKDFHVTGQIDRELSTTDPPSVATKHHSHHVRSLQAHKTLVRRPLMVSHSYLINCAFLRLTLVQENPMAPLEIPKEPPTFPSTPS